MTDLIGRLEVATGPDHKLDQEIFAHDRGWSFPLIGAALQEFEQLTREHGRTNYTGSIDAAVTLIPAGWSWLLACGFAAAPPSATVQFTGKGFHAAPDIEFDENAATPAIALCIAALEARAHVAKNERCTP